MQQETRQWFEDTIYDIQEHFDRLLYRQSLDESVKDSKELKMSLAGLQDSLSFIQNHPPRPDETVEVFRSRLKSELKKFCHKKERKLSRASKDYAESWRSGARSAYHYII